MTGGECFDTSGGYSLPKLARLVPTACDAIHTILPSRRENFQMTQISPPGDLNRQERKAFKILAQRLVDRGVDPIARAGLIAEVVRMEARLAYLRDAEKSAENASKMPATRALNVAVAEHRRLTVELYRGAARQPVAVVSLEIEAAETVNTADEAWRAYFWGKDRTFTHEQLERRYGSPGWGPLLYRTAEEQISWKRIAKEYPAGRRIPNHLVEEHNRLFPKGPKQGAAA